MNNFQNFSARARQFGLATAAVLAAASPFLNSAHAASATGDASATVVTPIAIAQGADLVFGKFSAGTGGSVVITPAGVRSATAGVVLLTGSDGAAATFDVTGDAAATYTITLPAAAATLTRASGSETMSVGTWVSAPASSGTLTSGAETIKVGATLTVANAQVPGAYAGTFDVSVEYN